MSSPFYTLLVTTYPPSVSPENHVIPLPPPLLYSPLNWLIIVHLITERYMYSKILRLILNTVSLFKTVVFCFLVLSINKFKKITQRIRFMLFLWLYSFHKLFHHCLNLIVVHVFRVRHSIGTVHSNRKCFPRHFRRTNSLLSSLWENVAGQGDAELTVEGKSFPQYDVTRCCNFRATINCKTFSL